MTLALLFPRVAGRLWMFRRFDFFFVFIVGIALVFFLVHLNRRSRRERAMWMHTMRQGPHRSDALSIARRRYASGEITKEQFETIRNDLKSE